MDESHQKTKEAALRWHFGLTTNPPLDMIGRAYLATVMPQRYSLRNDLLVTLISVHDFAFILNSV